MPRLRVAFLLAAVPLLCRGQSLAEFEKKVTEFTLSNGMQFLVVERHEAPVVSFHTYVKVGSLFDPSGQTGLAHMFEHMAFKGTSAIGSKNWAEEKKALDDVESAHQRLEAERRKGPRAKPEEIERLKTIVQAAVEKAELYVDTNAYTKIIESNGGVGLNAGTSLESTNYYYNFPSNRAELWFLLESERFLRPVFREFYKERDVVREERRMRVESNPQGKLSEAFLTTAFMAHPYRQVPIGWASDIENLRIDEAERFFKTYYVPSNMVACIAGDVNPAEVKRMAEKYFGRLPRSPAPPVITTEEPKQEGTRRVEINSQAQPMMFIGYKRPDQTHKDDPALDVLTTVLASGRTGMLYKELVRDKKLALAAISAPSYPGGQFPNLFVFLLVPNAGKTLEENEKALYTVLDKLKAEKIDAATLARVKAKARAGLIRQLDSNSGLAQMLPLYQVGYGDWRKMFQALDDVNKVTADDVLRVAKEYFIDSGKTVALTVQSGGKK